MEGRPARRCSRWASAGCSPFSWARYSIEEKGWIGLGFPLFRIGAFDDLGRGIPVACGEGFPEGQEGSLAGLEGIFISGLLELFTLALED